MERDQIWAPWRLEYVARDAAEDPARDVPRGERCFLCEYAADDGRDEANLVLLRGDRAFAVLNRYPYNNGHLLVAPREHLADPIDLDDGTLLETLQLVRQMIALLRGTMSPDGFNVGLNLGKVAGAGLPGHLHWHVVPRWNGDTNFMPVLGNVHVVPQSLAATWACLRESLDAERP